MRAHEWAAYRGGRAPCTRVSLILFLSAVISGTCLAVGLRPAPHGPNPRAGPVPVWTLTSGNYMSDALFGRWRRSGPNRSGW